LQIVSGVLKMTAIRN